MTLGFRESELSHGNEVLSRRPESAGFRFEKDSSVRAWDEEVIMAVGAD